MLARVVSGSFHQRHGWVVLVRQGASAGARWVNGLHGLRQLWRDHGLYRWAKQRFIGVYAHLRQTRDSGKVALVGAVGADHGQHIHHGARLETHHKVLVTTVCVVDVFNHHFVQAGRQGLDGFQRGGHFGVLFFGHRRRHEDAEVPHLFMNHVNDAVASDHDFTLVCVGVHNPVQRLLRGRDVVAVAGKHNDG